MALRDDAQRLEDVELALVTLVDLVFLDLDEGVLMSMSEEGRARAADLIGLRHQIGGELAERSGRLGAEGDSVERERVEAALAHGGRGGR